MLEFFAPLTTTCEFSILHPTQYTHYRINNHNNVHTLHSCMLHPNYINILWKLQNKAVGLIYTYTISSE